MEISNISSNINYNTNSNNSINNNQKIENIQVKSSNSDLITINNENYSEIESEKLAEKIDQLIEEVNKKLEPIDKQITYELHDKVNRYIITIKDRSSGDILKEIPAKEQVDIFAQILESSGLLFDELS